MKMRPLASSEAQTRTCEAENSCGSACHKKVANHSQPSLKQRHRRRQPSIACQCNHPTFTPPCHLTFSLITMTITITITNHPWWDFVMVGKCSALMIILFLMETMTIIVLIANDSCEGDFEATRANRWSKTFQPASRQIRHYSQKYISILVIFIIMSRPLPSSIGDGSTTVANLATIS